MTLTYRIFKYPVPLTDEFVIELPSGYRILDVQVQHGEPYLWAFVNPDGPTAERRFRLIGTGHPVDSSEWAYLDHISTFQLADGALVLHLFEVYTAALPPGPDNNITRTPYPVAAKETK